MKLDRLHEYVLVTTVMVVGTLLAILFGRFAGSGDNLWLMLFTGGVLSFVLCLTMRSNIWLLIPMFWTCSGQLNSLPLHLPLRDLVVIVVVLVFLTLKAFKVIRVKAKYTWLDFLLALNLLFLLSTYIRNPVGVNVLGSDLVGGRPYLEVIFVIGAYWVLTQVLITPRLAKWLPVIFSVVPFFFAILSTITYFLPDTVPILGRLYGGIDTEGYMRELNGDAGDESIDSRAQYLSNVGSGILSLMTSYVSPLTFFNPYYIWRFLLAGVAFAFCLKSGHRIAIPTVFSIMLLATYFRNGIRGVLILALITIPPLFLLVSLQGRLYNLPDPAQRALSIFSWGKWDPNVVVEAKGSSEWRFQMWDIVLHENKYIHNKTFGDGFGFTREALKHMQGEGSQEDFMILGEVHSGPVSSIRVVGFVGLGLFILLLVGSAIRAWLLVKAAKGTPFFPYALITCISIIYFPIAFIFIFGAYENDIVNAVINVAYMNLLSKGLAAYRTELETPPTPVPNVRRSAQPLSPLPVPAHALLP